MSTETEQETAPEHDERFVGRVTRVFDRCREHGVNIRPLRDEVEHVVQAIDLLRQSAKGADFTLGQRRVIADALKSEIKEGME